jgi:amidohydrolase
MENDRTVYENRKRMLTEETDKYHSLCKDLSSRLWRHPEISYEEFESSKAIVNLLEAQGYKIEYPLAGLPTAFRAVAGNDSHSRKMAIMTEYDALPEIGHACGHNISSAISVLAGLALRGLQDELDLDIHIIGTPAEERGGGKAVLIDHGVFDGYDMSMIVHLYDSNLIAPVCLALRGNLYTFRGQTAHAAATPWEGKNALNGVQLMFHGIDMMRQHVRPDVRIHGIVRNGGLIPNTVPEEASCEFYVRALNKDYADQIQSLVDDCARGAAIATQTSFEKEPTTRPYSDLKGNETGLKCLTEVFGELNLALDGDPAKIFASTDAGNVSYVCPTFHPCLGIAPAGTPLHTPVFAACANSEEAKDAIKKGALLIGLQTLKIFGSEEVLAKVKEDFKRQ